MTATLAVLPRHGIREAQRNAQKEDVNAKLAQPKSTLYRHHLAGAPTA